MTLLIVGATTLAAMAIAASRQRTHAQLQNTVRGQMTPSDQIRPLPRHIPSVDSRVYS